MSRRSCDQDLRPLLEQLRYGLYSKSAVNFARDYQLSSFEFCMSCGEYYLCDTCSFFFFLLHFFVLQEQYRDSLRRRFHERVHHYESWSALQGGFLKLMAEDWAYGASTPCLLGCSLASSPQGVGDTARRGALLSGYLESYRVSNAYTCFHVREEGEVPQALSLSCKSCVIIPIAFFLDKDRKKNRGGI
jgi:hypothetical protein